MKLDNEIRHYFKRWQAEQNVYKEIDIDKEEFEYKSLADEEYFKFKNGIARYTKKYAINNSGLIPMLGSSLKNDCIAYFVKEEKNTDIINQPCVSFNKDNAKGSRAFFRDCPFVMDRHHVCIFSKKVDPEYLCLALDRILIAQKYGWGENVANPSEVKKQHLLVSITSNANIVEKSLVRFIEYYKIQFNQYRQLISQLKSQVESFDKAFLPAIYSAKKDPFIVEYFDLWAQKNKKELSLTSIDFEYVPLFENTDNINLTGSKSLGNHDDIKHIEDADGLPVFDASSSILCHISESKFPDKVFEVKDEENPDISFASEGNSSAGTNFHIHSGKYFVNNHRTVVKFLTNKFYSKYVYYRLLNMKEEYDFKRGYTPSQSKLKSLDVSLWLPKGDDSLEVQKNIVEFIEEWRNWRDEIFQRVDKLSESLDQAEELLIAKTFKGSEE